MAKLISWECDHCLKMLHCPELPDGWVETGVTEYKATEPYLWCDRCWKEFKKVIPKVMPKEETYVETKR